MDMNLAPEQATFRTQVRRHGLAGDLFVVNGLPGTPKKGTP